MARRLSLMQRELALYFSAQEFLTRLPAPGWVGHEPDRLARASRYFPIVGLVIGALGGAVWLAASLVLPGFLAAGLTLGALLIVTGALHEDGLADCCDGLGGGGARERALEIMRDSRIGVFGAAGLIIALGLRWGALASLTPWEGAAALLIALAAGRAAMTVMLARGAYARRDGAAREAAFGVSTGEAAIAAAIALAAGLLLGGPMGAIAAAAPLLIAFGWLAYVTRRLGGYTGDTLGAMEQIGQIAALLILVGASS